MFSHWVIYIVIIKYRSTSIKIYQLLHIPYKRAKYQLLYFTLQRINYAMKTTTLEFYNYLTTVHWLSTTIWSWYFMLIGLCIAIPLHNGCVGTYTQTTHLNDTHTYPLFLTILKTKKIYAEIHAHTIHLQLATNVTASNFHLISHCSWQLFSTHTCTQTHIKSVASKCMQVLMQYNIYVFYRMQPSPYL